MPTSWSSDSSSTSDHIDVVPTADSTLFISGMGNRSPEDVNFSSEEDSAKPTSFPPASRCLCCTELAVVVSPDEGHRLSFVWGHDDDEELVLQVLPLIECLSSHNGGGSSILRISWFLFTTFRIRMVFSCWRWSRSRASVLETIGGLGDLLPHSPGATVPPSRPEPAVIGA